MLPSLAILIGSFGHQCKDGIKYRLWPHDPYQELDLDTEGEGSLLLWFVFFSQPPYGNLTLYLVSTKLVPTPQLMACARGMRR